MFDGDLKEFLKKEFEWLRHLQYQSLIDQEKQMSALTDLQAKFAKLKTDVEAFIAANTGGASDDDLTALSTQVDALDAEVAPAAPAAPAAQ